MHWITHVVLAMLYILLGTLAGLKVCAADEPDRLCDELALGTILASHHHGRSDGNEDQSPSLYISCDGWHLGFYENSYSITDKGDRSYFIGYEVPWDRFQYVEFSGFVGLVNGYPEDVDVRERKVQFVGNRTLVWAGINARIKFTENPWVPKFKIHWIPTVLTAWGWEFHHRFD